MLERLRNSDRTRHTFVTVVAGFIELPTAQTLVENSISTPPVDIADP
jgi:hypothetical protein